MGQSDLGNGFGSFCFALTVILQLGLCALILCQRLISTLVSGHLWCIQFSLVQVHIHLCFLLNSRGDNSDLGAIAANHHDHHQEPPQTVVLYYFETHFNILEIHSNTWYSSIHCKYSTLLAQNHTTVHLCCHRYLYASTPTVGVQPLTLYNFWCV